jgi:hypothetical protein
MVWVMREWPRTSLTLRLRRSHTPISDPLFYLKEKGLLRGVMRPSIFL